MMRTFEKFPEQAICPICGTNKSETTVLVPIIGTQEDNRWKPAPVHLDCLVKNALFDKKVRVIYVPALRGKK